jgi:hypothetical protein
MPAFTYELPKDAARELTAATEEVKRLLGSNPDPWQSKSRMR